MPELAEEKETAQKETKTPDGDAEALEATRAELAVLRAELAEKDGTLEGARALISEDKELNAAWERAIARSRGEETPVAEEKDVDETDRKIIEKMKKGDATEAINLALDPIKQELAILRAENAKLRSLTVQESAKTRAEVELDKFVHKHAGDGLYVLDEKKNEYVPGDREMLTEVNAAIMKHGTLDYEEALGLAKVKLGRGIKKQQAKRTPVGAVAGVGAKTAAVDVSSTEEEQVGGFNSEHIAAIYGADVLKDWRNK